MVMAKRFHGCGYPESTSACTNYHPDVVRLAVAVVAAEMPHELERLLRGNDVVIGRKHAAKVAIAAGVRMARAKPEARMIFSRCREGRWTGQLPAAMAWAREGMARRVVHGGKTESV